MRRFILTLASAASVFPLLAGAVNINEADAETLARELNGVGKARAQAIIQYRENFGAFESADELLTVSGIGTQVLDANRDNIEVGPLEQ